MSNILVFTAEWCSPCKQLKRNLEELGSPAIVIDVDSRKDLARQYLIEAIPTIITLDASGDEVSRTLGVKSVEELEQLIRNV
jgi:thioredoxin 1